MRRNTMAMLTEYMSLQEGLENKYGEQSIVLYMKGTFYEIYSLNTPHKKVGNIEKEQVVIKFECKGVKTNI